MATLYVTTTDGRISSYPLLRQETTIGRSKENDLVLLDHTVSRKHAKITQTDRGHLLSDLGSFNGTVVNGTSIRSAILKHEDVVKIGLNTLTYLSRPRTGKSFKGILTLSGGTGVWQRARTDHQGQLRHVQAYRFGGSSGVKGTGREWKSSAFQERKRGAGV